MAWFWSRLLLAGGQERKSLPATRRASRPTAGRGLYHQKSWKSLRNHQVHPLRCCSALLCGVAVWRRAAHRSHCCLPGCWFFFVLFSPSPSRRTWTGPRSRATPLAAARAWWPSEARCSAPQTSGESKKKSRARSLFVYGAFD